MLSGQKKKASISRGDLALNDSHMAVMFYNPVLNFTLLRYAGMSRMDEIEMEEIQTHDSNPFRSNRILLLMILTLKGGVVPVL